MLPAIWGHLQAELTQLSDDIGMNLCYATSKALLNAGAGSRLLAYAGNGYTEAYYPQILSDVRNS